MPWGASDPGYIGTSHFAASSSGVLGELTAVVVRALGSSPTCSGRPGPRVHPAARSIPATAGQWFNLGIRDYTSRSFGCSVVRSSVFGSRFSVFGNSLPSGEGAWLVRSALAVGALGSNTERPRTDNQKPKTEHRTPHKLSLCRAVRSGHPGAVGSVSGPPTAEAQPKQAGQTDRVGRSARRRAPGEALVSAHAGRPG